MIPLTGPISIQNLRDEFGGGTGPTNLSAYYRGLNGVQAHNTGVPTSGQISLGNFRGAFKGYSGSWDQGTPGTYNVTVPPRAWLRIRLWGAGAGGGGDGPRGTNGFNTTALGMIAGGGVNPGPFGGLTGGGVASGGNVENINGYNVGAVANGNPIGGGSPNGGAGGNWGNSRAGFPGVWPGGGGGGWVDNGQWGAGGGGGAFVHSLFGPVATDQVITIVVGAGGAAGKFGGASANGRALLEWGS